MTSSVKVGNLLEIITDDNKLPKERTLNMKLAINALTSAVIGATMSYVIRLQRGQISDQRDPTELARANREGLATSRQGEPTLDERAELDDTLAGEEFGALLSEMSGFNVPVDPLAIAQICDGIRVSMYHDMRALHDSLVDVLNPERHNPLGPIEVLYREPKIIANPNFDQPMSAERNLLFRIANSGVREDQVQRAIKLYEKPEDFVREALQEAADRDRTRLTQLMPEVLSTMASFQKDYRKEHFEMLPYEWQLRIGSKIADSLNREFKRLMPIALRTGDLGMGATLEFIKANHKEVQQWIDDMTRNPPPNIVS